MLRDAFDVADRQLKEMNEQPHDHKHIHEPGKREIMLKDIEADVEIQAPPADVAAIN